MDTSALKKVAQEARRALRDQVTAKLDLALAEGSAARREATGAVAKLQAAIGETSRDQVIEKVAYTWFNRFSALRFMDANGYTGVGVLSPREGETLPEPPGRSSLPQCSAARVPNPSGRGRVTGSAGAEFCDPVDG